MRLAKRRRNLLPTMPNPRIIIAQVAGSGTAPFPPVKRTPEPDVQLTPGGKAPKLKALVCPKSHTMFVALQLSSSVSAKPSCDKPVGMISCVSRAPMTLPSAKPPVKLTSLGNG
jgi:hypothetical protein